VYDITNDPDAFMYPRSIGLDAAGTAEYVRQVLTSNQNSGVSNVLKHFPGYGNNTDTHTAIAIDNRTLQELETVDLVPFQAGIDAGCSAIMVSHTFINAIDPTLPATLSPAVHGYLRQEMGFEGVIVTDDMVMQAITDLYGAAESAILAVLAGNDLLISTDYQIQYPAVLTAVEDGTIPLDLIYSAARRVLQWKLDMGILKI
jgi:beta-N-acetylhexosaminidase